MLTAVGVTVPGTYWILSTGNTSADHDHPGEAHHGSHKDEEHEEAPEEEQPDAEDEGSDRPKDSENRTESNQPPGGETQDQGLTKKGMPGSQPEGEKAKPTEEGKQVPGQPGKDDQISEKSVSGSGNFGEEQELENDKEGAEGLDKRIHKPDAKGGAKRRIESRAGKTLGQEEMIEGEDNSGTEKAAPSKDPVPGATSSKQAGLSNTDTKHSTDIGKLSLILLFAPQIPYPLSFIFPGPFNC